MSDPFVHLHVASGYSLRYGVSHPHVLVERAAEHGMDALALTDRDGLYGAVKFAKACMSAGLRPIFGVDLAVAGGSGEGPRRRTPARGGAFVDLRHPRVTLIAQHAGGWAALCRLVSATHLAGERGRPVCSSDLIAEHAAAGGVFVLLGPGSDVGRALDVRRPDLARGGAFVDLRHPRVTLIAQHAGGWAALCRLVSATHLAGERGRPVCSSDLIAEHAVAGGVFVLLGPDSDVGRALAVRRPDLARGHLDRWRAVVAQTDLVVELVSHRGRGDAVRAARAVGFAAEQGVSTVLTNAVRHVDRTDGPTADVPDGVGEHRRD